MRKAQIPGIGIGNNPNSHLPHPPPKSHPWFHTPFGKAQYENPEGFVPNREFKRKMGKKLKIKSEPLEPLNKGDCYFCDEPVIVSQGSLYQLINGQPAHRQCRKDSYV